MAYRCQVRFELPYEEVVFLLDPLLGEDRAARSGEGCVDLGSDSVFVFDPGLGEYLQVGLVDRGEDGGSLSAENVQRYVFREGDDAGGGCCCCDVVLHGQKAEDRRPSSSPLPQIRHTSDAVSGSGSSSPACAAAESAWFIASAACSAAYATPSSSLPERSPMGGTAPLISPRGVRECLARVLRGPCSLCAERGACDCPS